jgi:hypothetical protein
MLKNVCSEVNGRLCISFSVFNIYSYTSRVFREIHRNARLLVYMDPRKCIPCYADLYRNLEQRFTSVLRKYSSEIRAVTYVNRNSIGEFKEIRAKMSAFVTFDSP